MKFLCGSPGPKSKEIIRKDQKIISPSLTREYSLVVNKSKGCYLWDPDNKKYLDFASGISVANVGHNHPLVNLAIRHQLRKALHAGFSDFYSPTPIRFAEKLISLLPLGLNKVFLSNSGTETIEAAYKLVKWHTKKKNVLAFNNAFHGRTMGSLSLTESKPVHKEHMDPFLPVERQPYAYCYRCPWNKKFSSCGFECIHSFEKKVKKTKDLAAVFIEPVQGEGGYIVPPFEFINTIRDICDDYNVLLVADEVQSGCFRTGKFLASSHYEIIPDVVCLSKALGSGLPIGATIAKKEIMDWVPGSHANTFGGNLVACAAGIASLDVMLKQKLGQKALETGSYLHERLLEMQEKHKLIGDVRGLGLMIGVELVKDRKKKTPAIEERKKILCKCLEKGLVLLPAGKSTIRFCPALTITTKQIDQGLEILEHALKLCK